MHVQEIEKLTIENQEKTSLFEQQKHRILELGDKVRILETYLKRATQKVVHWQP
jgi:hypothetical protein